MRTTATCKKVKLICQTHGCGLEGKPNVEALGNVVLIQVAEMRCPDYDKDWPCTPSEWGQMPVG